MFSYMLSPRELCKKAHSQIIGKCISMLVKAHGLRQVVIFTNEDGNEVFDYLAGVTETFCQRTMSGFTPGIVHAKVDKENVVSSQSEAGKKETQFKRLRTHNVHCRCSDARLNSYYAANKDHANIPSFAFPGALHWMQQKKDPKLAQWARSWLWENACAGLNRGDQRSMHVRTHSFCLAHPITNEVCDRRAGQDRRLGEAEKTIHTLRSLKHSRGASLAWESRPRHFAVDTQLLVNERTIAGPVD